MYSTCEQNARAFQNFNFFLLHLNGISSRKITALGYYAPYSGRISPVFRRKLLTPGQPFQALLGSYWLVGGLNYTLLFVVVLATLSLTISCRFVCVSRLLITYQKNPSLLPITSKINITINDFYL